MRLNKIILFLNIILLSTNSFVSYGQAVNGNAPTGTAAAAENNVFANYFSKWTPMMQKLFQEVKNDKDYVSHYIGADVGTPYTKEIFMPAKIYYGDDFIGEVYFRYNAYNEEIELKSTNLEEEKPKALIKDENIRLIGDKNKLQYLAYNTEKGKVENGYLDLVFKGENYSVYENIQVKYTEGKPAEN